MYTPAFPQPLISANERIASASDHGVGGMSLLDWFAGHAPANAEFDLTFALTLAGPMPEWQTDPMAYLQWMATWQAKWRYMQAEAMMAEAERRSRK